MNLCGKNNLKLKISTTKLTVNGNLEKIICTKTINTLTKKTVFN